MRTKTVGMSRLDTGSVLEKLDTASGVPFCSRVTAMLGVWRMSPLTGARKSAYAFKFGWPWLSVSQLWGPSKLTTQGELGQLASVFVTTHPGVTLGVRTCTVSGTVFS